MGKGNRIKDILTFENPDAIIHEGMDSALIGIYRDKYDISKAVYSYIKYIEVLVKEKGMSEEEALEYFDLNVSNCRYNVEDHEPIIIDDTGV